MKLSGFTLPVASVPADVRGKLSPTALRDRLTVPPRSVDQMRTLERNGLFDEFMMKRRQRSAPVGELVILFRRPRRKQGDVATYGVVDIAVARLVGWLLKSGVPFGTVKDALRGHKGGARALLIAAVDNIPGAMLMLSDGGGCIVSPELLAQWDREFLGRRDRQLFPLAWLGMGSDVLPRLQKYRERQPEVVRWRQSMTPEDLHAKQVAQVAQGSL